MLSPELKQLIADTLSETMIGKLIGRIPRRRFTKRFLTRAVMIAVGLAVLLIPAVSISEDSVHVPNRDYFTKWTEPGDRYMAGQHSNTLIAKAVNPVDLGIPISLVEDPDSNRDFVWNYLLDYGFTEEQAAGVMGNLRQEHGYQTSGAGLAQWMGGRKARLMRMSSPYSLKTQLDFMVKVELEGNYAHVLNSLKKCETIESATLVFMRQYERPGIPATRKRIAYAYEAYNAYHKTEDEVEPIIVIEGSIPGQS
jgi:hypothetical protein